MIYYIVFDTTYYRHCTKMRIDQRRFGIHTDLVFKGVIAVASAKVPKRIIDTTQLESWYKLAGTFDYPRGFLTFLVKFHAMSASRRGLIVSNLPFRYTPHQRTVFARSNECRTFAEWAN